MTDLLEPEPTDVVLEIGTGSGYQAAVLSRLVSKVYSIEIVPQLADSASKRLRRLGFSNIEVKNADGYFGWQEHAPFDAIIGTAAPAEGPFQASWMGERPADPKAAEVVRPEVRQARPVNRSVTVSAASTPAASVSARPAT